ncbi:MAG: hypothetical protein V2I97_18500 [Desulfococcaceae bacterium]|jgi:chemotaxis signal transduction protein|nr:hypothetical protein [Desulfococcaceae bacterium]
MKEIMLFQAGDEEFGLYLSDVKGVYRASELAQLPLSPELSDSLSEEVSGRAPDISPHGGTGSLSDDSYIRVCRLPGGKDMLLYDFPRIFSAKTRPSPLQKIIRTDVGSIALAVLADHIERVAESDADRIFSLPRVFGKRSLQWFPSVFSTGTAGEEKRLVPILNPAGMAGIDAVAQDTVRRPPEIPAGDCRDTEEYISRCIRPDTLEKEICRAIRRGIGRGLNRSIFRMTVFREKAAGH